MLVDRVTALDVGLFDSIETQTSSDDRRSLLAVHNGVATRSDSFSYLEIGSHLGGTLQVIIADPRCRRAVSIDPRPPWQPDDRPEFQQYRYPGNSTQRMVELLRSVPDGDVSKLETIEASTEDIAPGGLVRADLCLIDGEHTYSAALRDARFCRSVMQGAGIVAFHDFHVVRGAIYDFLRETPGPRRGYLLSSSVFVVELGVVPTLLGDPGIRLQLRPWREWIRANRVREAAQVVGSDLRHRWFSRT